MGSFHPLIMQGDRSRRYFDDVPGGYEGFEDFNVTVTAGGAPVNIHGVCGGEGPGLLLLHGFPQTHFMWRSLASELAERFTVVATDLRGYGDSTAPPDTGDHSNYSFRAMAADQVEVMGEFGFDRFTVVGHDRGARVTHRMALDHPDAVERLALLDIMPTEYVYSHVDKFVATAYYHWFFFIQPFDLPEKLISADPTDFLRRLLGSWGSGRSAHAPEAMAEYERCFADPEVRHAMMEDYRAGASIDLEHDAAGGLITAPTLVLWGSRGVVARSPDGPLEVWKSKAAAPELVTGQAVEGAGHFLVEEAYEQTRDLLKTFFLPVS